jgi:hypothetical protein
MTLTGVIAAVNGINDLSMTTNGILLEYFADDLSKAGLHAQCATGLGLHQPENLNPACSAILGLISGKRDMKAQ